MSGSWDGASADYLSIADSASLSLPGTGWTWTCQFYYDTTKTNQTFQYLYSHAQPNNGADAANFLLDGDTGPTIRCILDNGIFNEDFVSSNTVNDDEWNTVLITSDGADIHLWLNGTLTTNTPFNNDTINPAGAARIGYASHGGSRVMRGRIAHMAKLDRFIADLGADHYTNGLFITPQFYQNSMIWHAPIWNGSDFGDVQRNVVISEVGSMVYGRHSPTHYQATASVAAPGSIAPTSGRRRAYFVAA